MDVLNEIKKALGEILDMEENEISPEAYMIRELGVESIDLLELAVALNETFEVEIDDDAVFLRALRSYLNEAKQHEKDPADYLEEKLPFLNQERITEILPDLKDGPVLKVKDIVSYIELQLCEV